MTCTKTHMFSLVYLPHEGQSGGCATLTFQLGPISSLAVARSWTIKINHLACDAANLAPNGCTQVTSMLPLGPSLKKESPYSTFSAPRQE